jgi:hypothetical protein
VRCAWETREKPYRDEWAVLETKHDRLIAYRVGEEKVDNHKLGASPCAVPGKSWRPPAPPAA